MPVEAPRRAYPTWPPEYGSRGRGPGGEINGKTKQSRMEAKHRVATRSLEYMGIKFASCLGSCGGLFFVEEIPVPASSYFSRDTLETFGLSKSSRHSRCAYIITGRIAISEAERQGFELRIPAAGVPTRIRHNTQGFAYPISGLRQKKPRRR
ncbi:hypothetical protein KM043_007854 [Ampulex compressa]|nr:hypothetical protein KM043_007854 [Ampulex compressa]